MSQIKTKVDGTDPVIQEIEKFMLGCENATKPTIEKNNNIRLNTENLLNILVNGSESDNMNQNKKVCPNKRTNIVDKKDCANEKMVLRKRKHEKTDYSETKKVKASQTRGVLKRSKFHSKEKRGRPKKENKSSKLKEKGKVERAKICFYKNERLYNLYTPKKRRAHILEANKLALVITTICFNDSYIVKNHIKSEKTKHIREEFIDLTEETSLYVRLNFAKIINISQPEETCEVTPKLLRNATIKIIPCNLNEFSVIKIFEHKVCIDLVPLVIDLIESDDDDFSVIISEKECVSEMLPLIHRFYQQNEENVMASEIIATVPTIDERFLKSRYSQADVIGNELIKKFDHKYMKNLDISRLLNLVVIKFEHKFKICIQPTTAAHCLYVMLAANIKHCNNQISEHILRKTPKFIKLAKVKLENQNADLCTDNSEAFTQEQLNILFNQIKQYRDICTRQEVLTAGTDFQDFSQSIPIIRKHACRDQEFVDKLDIFSNIPLPLDEVTKQIKEELLNQQY